MDVVPRERFQWFAAAALVLLFRPWQWRLGAKPAALVIALFLSESASAMDGANAYRFARSELTAGRWAEARREFEELTNDQTLLGWAHWGSGCAAASLASETEDLTRRRELTAAAIRSFREAVRLLRDPAERAAAMTNISVAKRRLEDSENSAPSTTPQRSDVVKRDESGNSGATSVGEANPNLDRKAGKEIGGGAVATPVAGLSVADPGPLSRAQAEQMLDAIVDRLEPPTRNGAGERPKQ